MAQIARIAGAVILPNLGGFYNRKLIHKSHREWYPNLKHPSFMPPSWIFPPVWTILYSTMGYASYLVWKNGCGFAGKAKLPLILYGTQLALSWAWPPIFFIKKDLKMSCIDILAQTGVATATGHLFYQIDRVAGLLFIPYLAWLSFATILYYKTYELNPDQKISTPKGTTGTDDT